MKKIAIFIGLKIGEGLGVCGIVGVLYGIGILIGRAGKWEIMIILPIMFTTKPCPTIALWKKWRRRRDEC